MRDGSVIDEHRGMGPGLEGLGCSNVREALSFIIAGGGSNP
jgi:hypothetical protein